LWNLKPGKRPELSSAPKAGQPGHVMISYSWGQKERMRELAHHLKEAGLPIWIDVEEMEGSILEKMAQAVENSDVMVIGVSASYHDSQACHMEAEYGHRLKKSMIFVMAEEGYNARGWLGLMLEAKICGTLHGRILLVTRQLLQKLSKLQRNQC